MFPLTCQCDGARWVAAAHRVVMDTLRIRLGLIRGLTLLSRHHSPSLSTVDEFKLYKRTDDGVYDDFPKISENIPKLFRRPDERFRTFFENFQNFLKVSEDCRRLSRKTRRCFDVTLSNEFKYNLRDKLDINERLRHSQR